MPLSVYKRPYRKSHRKIGKKAKRTVRKKSYKKRKRNYKKRRSVKRRRFLVVAKRKRINKFPEGVTSKYEFGGTYTSTEVIYIGLGLAFDKLKEVIENSFVKYCFQKYYNIDVKDVNDWLPVSVVWRLFYTNHTTPGAADVVISVVGNKKLNTFRDFAALVSKNDSLLRYSVTAPTSIGQDFIVWTRIDFEQADQYSAAVDLTFYSKGIADFSGFKCKWSFNANMKIQNTTLGTGSATEVTSIKHNPLVGKIYTGCVGNQFTFQNKEYYVDASPVARHIGAFAVDRILGYYLRNYTDLTTGIAAAYKYIWMEPPKANIFGRGIKSHSVQLPPGGIGNLVVGDSKKWSLRKTMHMLTEYNHLSAANA